MSRRTAREWIMKYMYQMDMSNDYQVYDYSALYGWEEIEEEEDRAFIRESLTSMLEHLSETDEIIEQFLQSWTLNRMPKVDLAILRLAINEINHMEDIPAGVTINEAVDIAKLYSTEDSYRFINGVLGSYYKSREE
ncbi:MAG: transcription antitermination factor NusB [Tissierellia bacterium]|nr:transcription antitermination factor NusB [Tissierellia bacterium]